MRNQPIYTKSGRISNMVVLFLLCFAVVFASLHFIGHINLPWSTELYFKPPIDKAAIYGVPVQSDTEQFAYSEATLGNGIEFGMATALYRQKDGSIIVYLSNPVNSSAYLLCEIKDPNGKVIAESGRVAPGKYIKALKPKRGWKNEATPVTVSVYAMDTKDCYSLGNFEFQTTLQPW